LIFALIAGTGLFCSPVTGGVLLSSHLTGTSQNDEIIEPIVHRLLSYFMLICEILSWSASALNGLLMKRITPAYLGSGLIDYSQKMTMAAMQIADMNV
jgi:hypothetical protein